MKRKEEYDVPQLFKSVTDEATTYDLILALKGRLKAEADKICHYFDNQEQKFEFFEFVEKFSSKPQMIEGLKSRLWGKSGIYVVKATSKFEIDASSFNKTNSGTKINDLNKKEIEVNTIIYVGKTQSILQRMSQHFSGESANDRTGSLKLGSKGRKVLADNIIIYFFSLKNEYKIYYNIIMAEVESWCHDKMKPIIGSPRV